MSNAEQPTDHAPGDGTDDDDGDDDGVARIEPSDFERNVKSRNTWTRLLFMIVMGIAWSVAVMVTSFVVVLNFFYLLFTGSTNSKLTSLGHSLATYLFQIVEYMTFNSESRPFPFDDDFPAGLDKD